MLSEASQRLGRAAESELQSEQDLVLESSAKLNGHTNGQPFAEIHCQQPTTPENDSFSPLRYDQSAPQINPFHLLSHPDEHAGRSTLPAHFQSLTRGNADAGVGEPLITALQSVADGQTPLHVTRVKHDTVEIITGPSPDIPSHRRFVQKVFKRGDGPNVIASNLDFTRRSPIVMQGAPPSPPISEPDLPESEDSHVPSSVVISESETTTSLAAPQQLSPLVESPSTAKAFLISDDITSEPGEIGSQTPEKPKTTSPELLTVPVPRRPSGSSTTSRTGSLAIVRNARRAQQRADTSPSAEKRVLPNLQIENAAAESSRKGSTHSYDSDLPSPTLSIPPRMIRRSTNPSSPVSAFPSRAPLVHANTTFSSTRSRTTVPGIDGAALDSDILEQAENIRRERLERRQKKLSADDQPVKEKAKEETKVLVGNLIGEDHVNYILMYNMLTGIRIGVSRCQAKMKRPLTDEDYLARHKYSFDIIGNELTPSARYDFKFKDYAPWVFRELREEHFHLDPADYLLSLTAKYILSELGSPGKSGSFFYFSRDYRFIIKTISHAEHKFLRSILKDYHEHLKTNPHTLLSRFYGLHRVKLPRGRKIHFVIMNNLFPPHRDIHETYDLKGSAYGREYPEEKAKKNPRAVLKDKNWVNRGRTLEFGPEKRALLSEQLRRDTEFLERAGVMDYSLLIGIHNMERGNRDNLRENQLTMFHPEMPMPRRKPSAIKGQSDASNVRKAVRRSDPRMLDVVSQLPTDGSSDRRHFLFYQDEGGLRATDEANTPEDVIYYLGIIDICTPYNTAKRVEHFWKSMTENARTISCVDPDSYGARFLDFLMSVMRGGDVSRRPEGLLPEEPREQQPVRPGQDNHGDIGNGNPAEDSAESDDRPAMVGHLKAE